MRTKVLFMALAFATACLGKDIKTITIEYDADKTNIENIIEGFKKINYEASEVKVASARKVDAETGATTKK